MARNTESEESENNPETTKSEGEIHDTISYRPRGRSINIVESDSTALDASRDLIDNIVDAVKRRAHEGRDLPDTVQAEFRYDPEEDRIVIKDNAYGGVHPNRLGDIPAMGASSDEPDLIGHFGVGGLRPAVLGSTIKYASSKPGFPASEITVDVQELRADEDGDEEVFVSPRRDVDLEEGWTRIIIEDLRDGVDSLLRSAINETDFEPDDDGDDDNDEQSDLLTVHGLEPVARAFGQTYTRLLRNGIDTVEGTIPFELTLYHGEDENPVEPADYPEILPIAPDGLWSREYRNVPFSVEEGEDPEPDVFADVQVGVKGNADEHTAGLYVSIQNRMVLYADLESRLFESQYLGTLRDSAGHFRLVIHVDLREADRPDNDRTYLPINSGKNGFDYNSSITPALLSFISNAASPYKKQGYDPAPQSFIDSYDNALNQEFNPNLVHNLIENEADDREDLVAIYDKIGSKTNAARVRPKPGVWHNRGRSFPERDALLKIAFVHAYFRIRVADPAQYLAEQIDGISVEKANVLATGYEYILEESVESRSYYDVITAEEVEYAPHTPIEVENGPDIDIDAINAPSSIRDTYASTKSRSPPELLTEFLELVKEHVDRGVRADTSGEIAEWQKPRYLEALAEFTDGDLSGLIPIEDTESEGEDVDEAGDEDISTTEGTEESDEDGADESGELEGPESPSEELEEDETEEQEGTQAEVESAESSSPGSESVNQTTDRSSDEDSGPTNLSQFESEQDETEQGQTDEEPAGPDLPDEGIVIVSDGETYIIDDDRLEQLVEKLGDVDMGEEFVDRIIEELERKEQLEQAAAVFKDAD